MRAECATLYCTNRSQFEHREPECIKKVLTKDSDKEEPMELTDNKSINGFQDVSENNKLETSSNF